MGFLISNDDSFVLKTGSVFNIYKIWPNYLIINATNSSMLTSNNYINNIITVNLTITNDTTMQNSDPDGIYYLYTSFEILFVPELESNVYSTLNSFEKPNQLTSFFSCGDQS